MLHLQLSHDGHELAGYSVLVVEDDYIVAEDLCSALRRHGATVHGPVASVSEGRAVARSVHIDCALLDINLHGELVFELAHELQSQGVRPIFTTGYDASFLPPGLKDAACLQKPLDLNALVRIILAEPHPARLSA